MRARASTRRSSFGMECVQCSNELVAPERSEHWSDRRACHIWYCRKCSGPVAELVGIEGGVVSGVFNLESSDVGASDRRPRHEERYHEV